MRIVIDGYEVELKARHEFLSKRFNKQDTLSFLCSLCCDLIEARDSYDRENFDGCVSATQKSIDAIYVILDENNYDPTK